MTAKQLMATARTAGIRLDACGDRLVYEAPRGVLTPELRNLLVRHKLDLLAVLWRLGAMRRLGVDLSGTTSRPPFPMATLDARGGPGRCFSCGDSLGHRAAYGPLPGVRRDMRVLL